MSSFCGLDRSSDPGGWGSHRVDFYKDRIYPVLVNRLGNPKPIQALRQRIVPLARGTVLEIGVGSGANFPHYDPAIVERLYALEPNPGMLRLADAQRRRTPIDIAAVPQPISKVLDALLHGHCRVASASVPPKEVASRPTASGIAAGLKFRSPSRA